MATARERKGRHGLVDRRGVLDSTGDGRGNGGFGDFVVVLVGIVVLALV